MYKGQRALAGFRKKVMQLLCDYGYHCRRHDQPKQQWYAKDDKALGYQLDYFQKSPSVAEYVMERDLKRFNRGEAHWRTETLVTDIAFLPLNQLPRHKPQWTLGQCQQAFYEWMVCGMEFEYRNSRNRKCYDTVRLIDYLHPELNMFRAEERWPAVHQDGFLWDIIITVNTMPLVAVVLQPTAEGQAPCADAYQSLERELRYDANLSTYVQICIVSDGKRTLVGTPTDRLEDYRPWDSLLGEEPAGADPLTPFRSLLRPDRLLEVVMHYNRLMLDEHQKVHKFLADYHQFFGIKAMVEVVKSRLSNLTESSRELGHIRLLREESQLTVSGFGDQAVTLCQLLEDQLLMLPELDAAERPWDVRQVASMPADDEICRWQQAAQEEGLLLIAHPTLTTQECRTLLQRLPDVLLLQVVQVNRGPVVDDFCGPCLYQPLSPIAL